MTEALPPPDDLAARQHLLGAAEAMIVRLIALARAMLDATAPGTLTAAIARHLAAHILAPAEAALRRTLIILAASIGPPPAPSRALAPRSQVPGPATPRTSAARPPRFRLIEPPVRPKADYLPVSQRPRISIAGDPPPPPPAPRRPADPIAREARIARRLEALIGALDNPLREARRLLRLRARLGGRPLLRFTKVPGRKAADLAPEEHTLLAMLNAAARDLAPGLPDTS